MAHDRKTGMQDAITDRDAFWEKYHENWDSWWDGTFKSLDTTPVHVPFSKDDHGEDK